MAQYEMNLRDYWLIVRRRRVIIVGSTVLVALLSFWFAGRRAPVYEATAAVKYEPATSLSGLLVEVLSYSSADSIETQAGLIKSYPVLEEAARRLGRLPQAPRGEPLRESRAYTAALDALGARIRTARVPNTSIIEITASAPDPREARDLANTVAEAYRDYNRQVRNARIREARKFIEAQLREVEARVKRAEEEVWAYREANRILAPGAESAVLQALVTQLRGELEKTRQQRTELELVLDRLAREDGAARGARVFVESPNPALQRLQATQMDLLLERNQLALEVTERHPRLQALDERLREVRAEMQREVSAQVALLRSREAILERQMGELLQRHRQVPALELGLQRLQRDVKVNDDLLTLLKTKHQEALIKESEGVEEVTLVRPATDPVRPLGTQTATTVAVGALLGLLLGLVLAFVQETLDTSIGTIEDVESYLRVPVLGIVPHIDPRETAERLLERRPALARLEPEVLAAHALLVTHFDPKSPVAEAYRTLRTHVQFEMRERGGKVLVVTSPTLQEGKTTTIVNLALTMAQAGQRTLLVGANLRRPSLHRFFGIEREPGLSDILVGRVEWQACIRTVTDMLMGRFEMEDVMAAPGLDNLHIIESGPVPANPSELLSTPAMARFLDEVREAYDVVLIDTPPVLPVTDSAIVAAQADGVILVYQAGKVGRLVLKRAKAHLESARARVWGVVLNDVKSEVGGAHYTHYYTHYYGEESTGETPREGVRRWWQALSAALPRGRARGAPPAPSGAGSATPTPGTPRPGRHRRRILLAVLGGLALVALGAWFLGFFANPPAPRELLRRRLEGPATRDAVRSPAPETPQAAGSVEGPAPPKPAEPPAAATAPPAPEVSPAPAASGAGARPRSAPVTPAPPRASGPRFAVEFGPFATAEEAERVERELSFAGYQTVRFRQPTGGSLYAVYVERVPGVAEAEALVGVLREQGFTDAVVQVVAGTLRIRVGEPMALRGAVELATRLRARGHAVRVAVQPGEAETFVVRHGHFPSRDEAEARSEELMQLGLPNHVVRVR